MRDLKGVPPPFCLDVNRVIYTLVKLRATSRAIVGGFVTPRLSTPSTVYRRVSNSRFSHPTNILLATHPKRPPPPAPTQQARPVPRLKTPQSKLACQGAYHPTSARHETMPMSPLPHSDWSAMQITPPPPKLDLPAVPRLDCFGTLSGTQNFRGSLSRVAQSPRWFGLALPFVEWASMTVFKTSCSWFWSVRHSIAT